MQRVTIEIDVHDQTKKKMLGRMSRLCRQTTNSHVNQMKIFFLFCSLIHVRPLQMAKAKRETLWSFYAANSSDDIYCTLDGVDQTGRTTVKREAGGEW